MSDMLFHKEAMRQWLFNTFQKHNWKSGEIILEFAERKNQPIAGLTADVVAFLEHKGIAHTCRNLVLEPISRDAAFASINFGLSVKVNYTNVDIPFDQPKRFKIATVFAGLFSNSVKYYTLAENESFYKERDTRDDFVERGGCVAVDENRMGILWITDFY